MAKGASIRRREEPIEKEELSYFPITGSVRDEYKDYRMTLMLEKMSNLGGNELLSFLRFCDTYGLLDEAIERFSKFHRSRFEVKVIRE